MAKHWKLAVLAFSAAMAAGTTAGRAEIVFSIYGGYQGAMDSNVSGSDPNIGDFDFDQRWSGASFKHPMYWGARTTWWLDSKPNWGVQFDYTHAKVYADPPPDGWTTFEFTDGLNLFTADLMYRFQEEGRRWTPYVGGGAGISMPHVEVQTSAKSPKTFEYQVGGPAIQAQAGVDYAFTDWLSGFAEYKFNYAWNSTNLDGGGSLDTDIAVHAVDIGVSLHWK